MSDPFSDEPESAPPQSDASDFFSGGSPSCRFSNIGDMHQGVITRMEKGQQRDIQTGAPKFWPDGNKCEQIVITLQTQEHDAEIDDDDGERRLYVNKPGGMFAAIKTALGKEQLKIGGTLAIKYVKNGPKKQAGFNAPKEYIARYFAPGAVAPSNPTQQQAAPSVQQQRQQSQTMPGQANDPVKVARQLAVNAFQAKHSGIDPMTLGQPWKDLLKSVHPDRVSTTFTAADWKAVREKINPPIQQAVEPPPFGEDDKEFDPDSIPF